MRRYKRSSSWSRKRLLSNAAGGCVAAHPASAWRTRSPNRAVAIAHQCAISNRSGFAVSAGDIATGRMFARTSYGISDAIITNPPGATMMHALISHFQSIAPTWLLLS